MIAQSVALLQTLKINPLVSIIVSCRSISTSEVRAIDFHFAWIVSTFPALAYSDVSTDNFTFYFLAFCD